MGLAYVKSVGEDDAGRVVAEREASGPFATSATSPGGCRSKGRPEALVAAAPATASGQAPRPALGARARARGRRAVQREHKQLTLSLEPTAATPDAARPDRLGADARRLRARRASRSASTRSSCCARTCRRGCSRSDRAEPGAARQSCRLRRARDRAPAAGHGERDRLHAARGRARPGEPDRLAASSTSGTGRSSAASRCCSRAAASSAWGENRNILVDVARDPRPARARDRELRRRRRSAARAPLRPPLTRLIRVSRSRRSSASSSSSAVLISPMCENACGKLPSSRSRRGSYSSESSPTSLRSASSRSNSSRASSCRPSSA